MVGVGDLSMSDRSALVVGGGIGGLTAALCLAERGWQVAVFEQAPAFGEVGAGIQLSPNATRVLHRLGLARQLRDAASVPEMAKVRHWRSGEVIAETPLGAALQAKHGFPYYHIHRADLLRSLVTAARDAGVELCTGTALSGVRQTAEIVTATFAGQHRRGELLIGADGIHSTVRRLCFAADRPRYTGRVAWRALVPVRGAPANALAPFATVWWGPGEHFVQYPLRRASVVNCVAVVEQKPPWPAESWRVAGVPGDLRRHFDGWHPDVRRLIDAMPPNACFKWALLRRGVARRWHDGRLALLGDACHPTLPFLAQGAALAIEDAAVLARCVAEGVDGARLRRYQVARRRRAALVQAASRQHGTLFHLRGLAAWLRDQAAPYAAGRTLDWLFRYNALAE